MKNKKLKLLVSIKGLEASFGPVTVCLIGVDSNIERISALDVLIKNKSRKIFDDGILIHHYINKIDAKDLNKTTKQISDLAFNALNTVKDFWEHDIFILNRDVYLKDLDQESNLAKHIKKAKLYIGESFYSKQLKKLVEHVHSCYYDEEYNLLKVTYGDEKCIHTRK